MSKSFYIIDGHAQIYRAYFAPFRELTGPSGEPTKLVESISSTIPGSPAYVSKAGRFKMVQPEIGVDLELKGHNAIQGEFRLEG